MLRRILLGKQVKLRAEAAMTYKSILVNLDIDSPIVPTVKIAIDLATRFDARLIGYSAADAHLPYAGPDGGAIAAEVWEQETQENERRFEKLRSEFEKLTAGTVKTEWRQTAGDPTRSLARTARLVDLIVTGAPKGAATGDAYRTADPGSLVLQAGRPVLVAASGDTRPPAKKIVVAWKDTREARRAVADALPLLLSADEVAVATAARAPDDDARASLADVASFLLQHGIRARTELITASEESESLREFSIACQADAIISGAYGHSRLREWAFGGLTRSLLNDTSFNRFMAS